MPGHAEAVVKLFSLSFNHERIIIFDFIVQVSIHFSPDGKQLGK